jgi:putative endonuclease
MLSSYEIENDAKTVGRLGEDIACQFLIRKGFKVLERNFRKPWGEIDIVAVKDGRVRFIEVKAVSRENLDDSREMDYRPEELATPSKLKKVARTSQLYMEQKKDRREYQIDVVAVIMDIATKRARCRFIEQALEDNL